MCANPKPVNFPAIAVAQDTVALINASRPNIQTLIYLLKIEARMEWVAGE